MKKATTLGGLALVLAVAALAFAFLAFTQAREANTKADNLVETLGSQQLFGVPMKENGSVDEEELQKLMQQRQPSQEELEEMEEQQQNDAEQ